MSYEYSFTEMANDPQATWSTVVYDATYTFDPNTTSNYVTIDHLLLQERSGSVQRKVVTSIDIFITDISIAWKSRIGESAPYVKELIVQLIDDHGKNGRYYVAPNNLGAHALHIPNVDQIVKQYEKQEAIGKLTISLHGVSDLDIPRACTAHIKVTLHGKSVSLPKKASNETYTSDPDTMFASAGYSDYESSSWG